MFFDGSCTKDGVGAGVVPISLENQHITQSCKLDFEVTNNVAEYEAFLLGLQLAKSLKVHNLSVFTDSELIVRQVIHIFQTKQLRLRSYRNDVLDSIESFLDAFNITYVPRNENIHVDSLVVSASSFNILDQTQLLYQI